MSSNSLLLDASHFRKLERFSVPPPGPLLRGGGIGHRRSPTRGAGLEFADHKEYSANELLAHLGKDGAFAYDKVLEKVDKSFPGPGRSVIGTVEGIDSPIYDPRSQSRDAIFAGGSDAAGTEEAAAELAALIRRCCKDGPRPKAPVRRIGAGSLERGGEARGK